MTFDVLIIGAGLSGLAAGIRLAHFGKRVVIVEAHSVCGGLNSYYRRGPRMLDVGLHAMTNFVGRGTRGAPLTKLLRQLRIPHAALGLIEQSGSVIQSPSCSLRFTNDFEVLRGDVRENFPGQIDSFDRLTEIIDGHDEATLDPPVMSARKVVVEVITDPQLAEMLFVPLMYYGNPAERDMDFAQFAVMWKALYRSGLARPEAGMKHVVDLLVERYSGAGGELRLRTSVEELVVDDGRVVGVRLAGGEEIAADQVLSSAGLVETMRLCSDREASWLGEKIGRLSFVELIATLDVEPRSLGIDKTIVFFDDEGPLQYRRPDGLVGLSSGVICCPNNFEYREPPAEGMVRITARASYPAWREVVGGDNPRKAPREAREAYRAAKAATAESMLAEAVRHVPDFRDHITFTDMFTPLTIARYTGHLGGAVYGSPDKARRGQTPVENLFLCGSDQGFLGIVGSMLSGISMVNLHCLS